MNENPLFLILYLYIVNHGKADKVIDLAYANGIPGATVFFGYGTVTKGLLYQLGLSDSRKEIVMMVADDKVGDQAVTVITKALQMHKPHHGIMFSIPLLQIIGSSQLTSQYRMPENEEKTMEYQAIFTIVDKGRSEEVIDAAVKAGATGATVINARGSGSHAPQRIFNIPIQPEKEIILIIARQELVQPITEQVRQNLKIDDPGKGIIFVSDVRQTYGLFHQDNQ
jgi:nitrogen regulatory protein PII